MQNRLLNNGEMKSSKYEFDPNLLANCGPTKPVL